MHSERLWAKSWDSRNLVEAPRSAHFAEHLKDVLASAERVLYSTADDQLAALGLPVGEYKDRFIRIVRVAAAIHDLGKANDHFQTMVRGIRNPQINPQGVRHEWATILIVAHLREWLLPAVNGQLLDLQIAEWAVAGHHPAGHHESPPRSCPPGAGSEVKLFLNHADFRSGLEWLRSALGVDLGPPPAFEADNMHPLTGNENAYQSLSKWEREANRTWESLFRSPDRRLVPAVKNCLIASDIAGSALPRQVVDGASHQPITCIVGHAERRANALQERIDWIVKLARKALKDGRMFRIDRVNINCFFFCQFCDNITSYH